MRKMSNLVEYREKINRININRKLEKEQEKINELYEENGLTDEVLEAQIELNKLRHEHDIHDKDKTLHENYVQ